MENENDHSTHLLRHLHYHPRIGRVAPDLSGGQFTDAYPIPGGSSGGNHGGLHTHTDCATTQHATDNGSWISSVVAIGLWIAFWVVAFVTVAFAADMPDAKLTPGVSADIDKKQICATAWGKDERHVDEAVKRKVYAAYGFDGPQDKRCPCEIDHYISRELGGADDIRNLWPQPYNGPWNAHMKDRVENALHKKLCAGTMSLEDAQYGVRHWTIVYKNLFGDPDVRKARHRLRSRR